MGHVLRRGPKTLTLAGDDVRATPGDQLHTTSFNHHKGYVSCLFCSYVHKQEAIRKNISLLRCSEELSTESMFY